MSSENFDATTQSNEVRSFSEDEIKNFFKKRFKEIKAAPPSNVKLVDKDEDGNSKYVFDKGAENSIYKDQQLIHTARAYYYERDGLNGMLFLIFMKLVVEVILMVLYQTLLKVL